MCSPRQSARMPVYLLIAGGWTLLSLLMWLDSIFGPMPAIMRLD